MGVRWSVGNALIGQARAPCLLWRLLLLRAALVPQVIPWPAPIAVTRIGCYHGNSCRLLFYFTATPSGGVGSRGRLWPAAREERTGR